MYYDGCPRQLPRFRADAHAQQTLGRIDTRGLNVGNIFQTSEDPPACASSEVSRFFYIFKIRGLRSRDFQSSKLLETVPRQRYITGYKRCFSMFIPAVEQLLAFELM